MKILDKIRAIPGRVRQWNRELDREYNRSLPIVVEVRLPFTPANEQALRVDRTGKAPITAAYAQNEIEDAIRDAFPGLRDIEVKIRQNPNWRS